MRRIIQWGIPFLLIAILSACSYTSPNQDIKVKRSITSSPFEESTTAITSEPSDDASNMEPNKDFLFPDSSIHAIDSDFMTSEQFPVGERNFVVHQFQSTYDQADHAVDYLVTYSLGSVPAEYLLKNKHSYYMYLTLPDSSAHYFTSNMTEALRGVQPSEDYLNEQYQLEWSTALVPKLSEATIQGLIGKLDGYKLTLYEDESSPAYTIDNLQEQIPSSNQL